MTPLLAVIGFFYGQIINGNYDKQTLRAYAIMESQLAGIDGQMVVKLIDGENKDWIPDRVHYNDAAIGCNSVGLAQIRDCNHPEVSYKQAIDPIFAINFIISHIDKCKTWWKSTCPLQTYD